MNPLQRILVAGIQLYRWVLSPAKVAFFGPLGRCRYTPSCSTYALEAVREHGAAGGSWLAVKRVCRCHPWGGCGEDPVPPGKAVKRGTVKRLNGSANTVLSLPQFNDSRI